MSLDISLLVIKETEVYEANITHNLVTMAQAVDIYDCVWCSHDKRAYEIIEQLRTGIEKLRSNPELYKKYDPPNKWGSYDVFVPWLEKLLAACIENPDARISIWK